VSGAVRNVVGYGMVGVGKRIANCGRDRQLLYSTQGENFKHLE
jgi:hypothetical protein